MYWVLRKVLSHLKKILDIPLESNRLESNRLESNTSKESLLKDEKKLLHEKSSSFNYTDLY